MRQLERNDNKKQLIKYRLSLEVLNLVMQATKTTIFMLSKTIFQLNCNNFEHFVFVVEKYHLKQTIFYCIRRFCCLTYYIKVKFLTITLLRQENKCENIKFSRFITQRFVGAFFWVWLTVTSLENFISQMCVAFWKLIKKSYWICNVRESRNDMFWYFLVYQSRWKLMFSEFSSLIY